MPWFKVDDRMPDHAKTRKAGTSAIGLWALAGAWSSGNLTDGFVPKEIAKRWDSSGKLSKKLVEAGLWLTDEVDGEAGFRFHDWDEHQPSRTDVLARRKAAAARVAKHREKRTMRNNDVSNDDGNASRNALQDTDVTPPPTRPDPTRPEDKETATPVAAPTESPLFPIAPTPELKAKAPAKRTAKATTKAKSTEALVADAVYERLQGSCNWNAVRAIAKTALARRGAAPEAVVDAMVGINSTGAPITAQTVGQWLDGITGPNGRARQRTGPSRQDEKVRGFLESADRLADQYAAEAAIAPIAQREITR